MSEWISVEERLPSEGVLVIVWDGKYYDIVLMGEHNFHTEENVTHWMPLPEPPK